MKKILLFLVLGIHSCVVGNIVEALERIQGNPYASLDTNVKTLFGAVMQLADFKEGETSVDKVSYISDLEVRRLADAIGLMNKRIIDVRKNVSSNQVSAIQYDQLLQYLETTANLNHGDMLFVYPALLGDKYKVDHVQFLFKSFCVALSISYTLMAKAKSSCTLEEWLEYIRAYLKTMGYTRASYSKIASLVEGAYVATWEQFNAFEGQDMNFYYYLFQNRNDVDRDEAIKMKTEETILFFLRQLVVNPEMLAPHHAGKCIPSSLSSSPERGLPQEMPNGPRPIKKGYSPLTKSIAAGTLAGSTVAALVLDNQKRLYRWCVNNPIKAITAAGVGGTSVALTLMALNK